MNGNYVAEIQSTCIPNEQLVAGQHVSVNIYYPDMLPWCKRGFTLSGFFSFFTSWGLRLRSKQLYFPKIFYNIIKITNEYGGRLPE